MNNISEWNNVAKSYSDFIITSRDQIFVKNLFQIILAMLKC